jgi:hypothetical protein
MKGASDVEIMKRAVEEKRVIITMTNTLAGWQDSMNCQE